LHLTIFNRCYWPDSEATGQLLTELAEFLAPRHSVRVVVGQPNFAAPTVQFLPVGTEVRHGVEIHRLRHAHVPKEKRFGRARNLISFTLAVRMWLKKNHAINRNLQSTQPTTWICETDPFLMPLVVGPAARKCGARVIYYLQDIYPDVAIALGVTKNRFPIRTLRRQLKKQYARADRIIVLDDDMRDRLVDWGIEPEKIAIVPNWMDCSMVRPIKEQNPVRSEWKLDHKFVVMHSGNMGLTQNLHVLIEAMQRPNVPGENHLVLVGNGAKRAELERLARGAGNVSFYDYQPRERLAASLSAADLHVVSMDAAITGCLAPSKLYGILASGTPVLAIVPRDNAVWRLVTQHRLGWCVEPGDAPAIARAIGLAAGTNPSERMAMGTRGRQLAETKFDKQVCCEQFDELLKNVARRSASSRENRL
jgi:glycosyltransferase involved in cell wall biosynthesis